MHPCSSITYRAFSKIMRGSCVKQEKAIASVTHAEASDLHVMPADMWMR